MSADIKGVLTPAASIAWKLLLLVASIAVGSIEVYKIVQPHDQKTTEVQSTVQDMSKIIYALKSENDAQTRSISDLQEKFKTSETYNEKEHTKLTEQIESMSEKQMQMREKIATLEARLYRLADHR